MNAFDEITVIVSLIDALGNGSELLSEYEKGYIESLFVKAKPLFAAPNISQRHKLSS